MPLPQTLLAPPDWVQAQNPADWLMPEELAILAAWPSPTRRTEWLAGRLAAKRLLRRDWELSPQAWKIGREGAAPTIDVQNANDASGSFAAVTLSLSHCGGLGAASWSAQEQEGAVGVDVQRIRPVHPGLHRRVLTAAEQRQLADCFREDTLAGLLLFWSLKEAAIKARRIAWGRSLREMDVRLTKPGQAEVRIDGEERLTAAYTPLPGGWWLTRALRSVTPPQHLEAKNNKQAAEQD